MANHELVFNPPILCSTRSANVLYTLDLVIAISTCNENCFFCLFFNQRTKHVIIKLIESIIMLKFYESVSERTHIQALLILIQFPKSLLRYPEYPSCGILKDIVAKHL